MTRKATVGGDEDCRCDEDVGGDKDGVLSVEDDCEEATRKLLGGYG
jgi:hypothetical protein